MNWNGTPEHIKMKEQMELPIKKMEMDQSQNKINLIRIKSSAETINRFAQDVKKGLSAKQKSIPAVYFYDQKGSELFEKICGLEEYYQTRKESQIILDHAEEIALNSSEIADIIELGSGSSIKTKILLESFLIHNNSINYFPIDVSEEILYESAKNLNEIYTDLYIFPVADRYIAGLKYIYDTHPDSAKLLIWLGSSIGNLDRNESINFLKNMSNLFGNKDRLLIGMDLKKDADFLESAYNDSKGITAEFNLNLLNRINDELKGEFIISNFYHRAVYNKKAGRIEMHLVSKIKQDVYIGSLDQKFHFDKDEYIHTENSYKYDLKDIKNLASRSGFRLINHWTDDNQLFSLNEFVKSK